jgi:hypothetical protein
MVVYASDGKAYYSIGDKEASESYQRYYKQYYQPINVKIFSVGTLITYTDGTTDVLTFNEYYLQINEFRRGKRIANIT